MSKPVYAVTDVVPEECTFLTAEKRYPTMGVGDGYFEIIDDEGDQIICNWKCCNYLDGQSWRRIEGEEADPTPVTQDDLAKSVIAYDDLLRGYAGPLSILCAGDVASIDAAYDALVAQARALIERARAGGAA